MRVVAGWKWTAVRLLYLGVSTAAADDAFIENVGGTIKAMGEHPTIELTAEYVHAWLRRDSVEVECVFYLRNTGAATTVKIGFPEMAGGVDVEAPSRFARFASWVDGRRVETVAVTQIDSLREVYWRWWVKEVSFDSLSTRVIRNHYVAAPGGVSTGHAWFEYILETGASWSGRIGLADIVLTFDEDPEVQEGSLRPRHAIRERREIRWHLRDFEPGENGENGSVGLYWKPMRRAPE